MDHLPFKHVLESAMLSALEQQTMLWSILSMTFIQIALTNTHQSIDRKDQLWASSTKLALVSNRSLNISTTLEYIFKTCKIVKLNLLSGTIFFYL